MLQNYVFRTKNGLLWQNNFKQRNVECVFSQKRQQKTTDRLSVVVSFEKCLTDGYFFTNLRTAVRPSVVAMRRVYMPFCSPEMFMSEELAGTAMVRPVRSMA